MKMEANIQFLIYLRKSYQGRRISYQEYKTLKGQCLAGDEEGAMRGIDRLLAKKKKTTKKVGALS